MSLKILTKQQKNTASRGAGDDIANYDYGPTK